LSGSGATVIRLRANFAAHHPTTSATTMKTPAPGCPAASRLVKTSVTTCSWPDITQASGRNELALEAGNLVLQQQLPFLQPAQLHLVDVEVELQAMDHVVEVAMLDAQRAQPLQVLERLVSTLSVVSAIASVVVIPGRNGYFSLRAGQKG
jgi:hypothetical protein